MILGCTHYPLFKDLIKKELGDEIDIINTGEKIANYLQTYLLNAAMENNKKSTVLTMTGVAIMVVLAATKIVPSSNIASYSVKIQKINIE